MTRDADCAGSFVLFAFTTSATSHRLRSKRSPELGLRDTRPSVNGLADVYALPGFRVATDVDADQPCAGSTANDLANLAYHFCLLRRKCGTRVAHVAAA